MAMEWVRSSIAALHFLTLVALAAASANGGGDAAAAAAAVEEQQCRPLASEPYMPQLGATLANTMAAAAADDEQAGYMLFGMQTGGGDKISLVVAADQRYFFITGFAKPGFSNHPSRSFRDGAGDRRRLVPSGSSSRSHAAVVASNVLRALMDAGKEAGY